jgi:hypothetical protein
MKIKHIIISTFLLANMNLFAYAENIIFPEIKGEDLTGKLIQLPKDSIGKPTFIILGYSYKSREKSEKWLKEYERKFSKTTNFYLVPMMGNKTPVKAMSFFINKSMKNSTPVNEQPHVITVYEDLNPIKNALSFNKNEDLYVYLLDAKGNVIWSETGEFKRSSFHELEKVLKNLN